MTSSHAELTDGTVILSHAEGSSDADHAALEIKRGGAVVGSVLIERIQPSTGLLSWQLNADHVGRSTATRAIRLVADWSMTDRGQGGLGLGRIEARISLQDEAAQQVATRAGLRREGVTRPAPGHQAEEEQVLLARISTDPPLSDPASFRSLLNSFLPRKRAIGQMLVRDPEGRILLCQLTYKRDWDLPGGVVEVGESPRLAVSREVEEELALQIPAGELVLTDWLPPWGGWDDAVCLVFDGGVHEPSLIDGVRLEEREIRSVAFLTVDEIRERAADFTARRIEAALAALEGGPTYSESGRTSS